MSFIDSLCPICDPSGPKYVTCAPWSYAATSKAQRVRVDAERRTLEMAELRYRGGVAAYLEVLDAQRAFFSAELDEAQTVGSHLNALVRLYKALGGGWPPDPQATSTTATP